MLQGISVHFTKKTVRDYKISCVRFLCLTFAGSKSASALLGTLFGSEAGKQDTPRVTLSTIHLLNSSLSDESLSMDVLFFDG